VDVEHRGIWSMTWNPDLLLEDFRRVAGMAGVSLAPDASAIDRRPAPHVPPRSLSPGRMAVDVFTFGQHVLKVGSNSAARRLSASNSLGVDSSPVAVAITALKLVEANVEEILDEARAILTEREARHIPASEF